MIICTKCSAYLPEELFNSQGHCPICDSLIRADVFPAAFSSLSDGKSGETLLVDNESSCFFHPNKQAVTTCSYCGRFLCSLCDIDFENQHLCASCLDVGKSKGKIKKLENHRVLYDNIALGLAILPIFLVSTVILWVFAIPAVIIAAPAAIFIVIRFWKKPSSIIKRSKLRMVLALLLACLQIAGALILLLFFISKIQF